MQNRSLHFDGINDVVIGPSSPLLEISAGTVELWIKPETKATSQTFLCYRNNTGSQTRYLWNLLGNLTGLGFWNGSGYNTFNYVFTSGVWYHLAFVGETNQTKIYINGIKVGVFNSGFGTATGNGLQLVLGYDIPLTEYYKGEMDEVRIWSRQLCTTEILSNMSCNQPNGATGLVAYYNFDEGIASGENTSITSLEDKTPNGLNGTLTNFALNGNASNWLSSTNGINGTCSNVNCPPAHIFTKSTSPISLYRDWRLYLTKTFERASSGFWMAPKIFSSNGTDTIEVPNYDVQWSVQDTNIASIVDGSLRGKISGNTKLFGTINGVTLEFQIIIKVPVKNPDKELNIDPLLTKPNLCAKVEIPVLIIAYLPTLDGVNLDAIETGPNVSNSISTTKSRILQIAKQSKFMLEEGSKFRGYANSNARPYINYKVLDYLYFYEPVPRGFPSDASKWYNDYHQILDRINLKKYVDSLGVKEVWLFQYDWPDIKVQLTESNMSSPFTGDISNSGARFNDDMPVYSNSYIVYGYNFNREGNEATHNHGHQIEAMCHYIDINLNGNNDFFEKKFVGVQADGKPLGRCGNTHFPPNATSDYDYYNSRFIESDIMDWKPDGTGAKQLVNKDTWGNIPYAYPPLTSSFPDEQSNWYVFWMQSIPGLNSSIPYGTKYVSNWWKFVYEWDQYYTTMGLYQDLPEPIDTCTTCYDGIKNGSETGIDCGGSCLPCSGYSIVAKAILGGAYFPSGDTMSTALKLMNKIPIKCPYDTSIVLANLPSEMVDWVSVDLVDTLTGDTTFAKQCACLIKNGLIKNLSGDTTLSYTAGLRTYFSIKIRHRNHLSVRTMGLPYLSSSTTKFDFRLGNNIYTDPTIAGSTYFNVGKPQLFYATDGIRPNRYTLWPGDANGDGQVKYQGSGNDRGVILSAIGGTNILNTVSGYLLTDINLNGQVKYQGSGNDRAIILTSIGGTDITKITKAHN